MTRSFSLPHPSMMMLLLLLVLGITSYNTLFVEAWQPSSLFGRRTTSKIERQRLLQQQPVRLPHNTKTNNGGQCSLPFPALSMVSDGRAGSNSNVETLKEILVNKIKEFRKLKERDGDVSIDFGVKGGELNSTSRAPQKIDFYTISKDVGDKANEILEVCEQLSKCIPKEQDILDKEDDDDTTYTLSKLNGPWKSLFTTAADANFNKNSTRGGAKVQNVVNSTKGTITNVIDFEPKEDSDTGESIEPTLKQLNVVIKAIPLSSRRVELQFKYAKLVFTRFFMLKRRWSLYIPVPAAFITRCIVFVSRILKFGRKKGVKKVPKAYLDLMYLDADLRIHKTGEDNIFVQVRDTWELTKPLIN